jgi:hypothetical protein
MKLSEAQYTYIKAKALYETLKETFRKERDDTGLTARIETAFESGDDTETDKLLDQELNIRDRLGLSKAAEAMFSAEDNLIGTFRSTIRLYPQYDKNKTDLDKMFDNYKHYPRIRDGLINLALKFKE